LVFVTPHGPDSVAPLLDDVRGAEVEVGRPGRPLLVHADLLVLLESDEGRAADALDHLDRRAGRPLRSDAEILATTPAALADRLVEWHGAGIDGVRRRPARLPADLDAIVDGLVPELRARGLAARGYESDTLRGLLGLERPVNRYAPPARLIESAR